MRSHILSFALLLASSGFTVAESDIDTSQMEIGTNFWDIGWGGAKNQPFKTSFKEFKPEENPWNPEFLEEIKIYSVLRFMDWIKTNSVEREWERGNEFHKSWETRVKPDDPVQRPMAWEWMVDLCNRTGSDLWITVPHVVDDAYVRELAKLIEGSLDERLNCWVEWSNETWNGMFTQSKYVNRKGQEIADEKLEGAKYGKKNEWYTGQIYHAVRTLEVHKIFLDVFGKDDRERLVLVMGGGMPHAFYRDSHLFTVRNKALNPHGIVPDAYALAPYVGNGLTPDDPQVFDKLKGEAMEKRMQVVRNISAVMEEAGIKMVCYEGGQHAKHTLKGVIPMQKRPEMAEVYQKYLGELSEYMTHFNHYTHTGGSWGAKEFIGEDSAKTPKYNTLREWSEKHNRPKRRAPSP